MYIYKYQSLKTIYSNKQKIKQESRWIMTNNDMKVWNDSTVLGQTKCVKATRRKINYLIQNKSGKNSIQPNILHRKTLNLLNYFFNIIFSLYFSLFINKHCLKQWHFHDTSI